MVIFVNAAFPGSPGARQAGRRIVTWATSVVPLRKAAAQEAVKEKWGDKPRSKVIEQVGLTIDYERAVRITIDVQSRHQNMRYLANGMPFFST